MMYQVCADESYRLDAGGATMVALGGWLSRPDNFQGFCSHWEEVLKAYGAPYFHFSEFADRKHLYHDKTPYDGWADDKREDFLFDLALAACEVGVPVGACVFPGSPPDTKIRSVDFAYALFFAGVWQVMKRHFEPSDTVEFVFDVNDDPLWFAVMTENLKAFKDIGAPFGLHGFQDDKVFLPLQAADLYVYAMRQNAERFGQNRTQQQPRLLDLILEKNRYDMENWTFRPENWAKLMRMVIDHWREWKKTNPNQKYYPLVHCPLLQPS